MKSQPPQWADKLLEWFCAPHLLEEVQGDLHERFLKNARVFGEKSARRDYVISVLGFIKPFALRRKTELTPSIYNKIMISNYFKIAFRNILKYKGYSFINILGLATGMAVAMLIGLWIYDELSFNKNHQNHDKIAQIRIREVGEHGVGISNSVQYPLLTDLQINHHDNFKHIVATSWNVDNVLSAGENKVGRKGLFMSPGAPEMLTLKMQYGSRNGLKDPNSIMLSASTSQALFGDTNPVNQIVKISNETNVKVTGVYEDLPLNSQFNELKFICPFDLWVAQNKWLKEKAMNDWDNHFLKIYAQLNDKIDFARATTNIKDAILNNLGDGYKDQAKLNPQVFLLPMNDWHLHNYNRSGELDTEAMRMVWLISIIGAFVLLLACINFMNLSTARSEKRAKEVGVRKAIGSMRAQLIWQFFSESFLVVAFAFILSLLFVALSLSWFNQLAAKEMIIPFANPYFWFICLGFIVMTGLLAGSYPALYLSSFQPVKVLKGTFRVGRFASVPRKVLVVVQFTVSVTLIIGTIIVFKQIQFAKNRPVGYTREGVIMIDMKSGDFYGKHDLLRNELLSTGAVTEMAESMGKPTEVWSGNDGFEWRGRTPDRDKSFGSLMVTPEYGKTVGWQFKQGRDFNRQLASDSAGMVINEAAVKYMGLKNPVGEDVSWKFREKTRYYKILGVIKDMVMESPYEPTSPVIFMIRAHGGPNTINIKINPSISTSEALPKIEAVFKKLIPTAPFEYKFVDEEYARKFAAEERIGQLANFCAILAILISCLGLFGLASFVAEQRIKEIGIRKILGASISNLWALLSKDFVLLVVISLFIASPIAYYFMEKWIQKYTYHTEISWWIFALAGIGAMVITILTVSYQAIKAALMNPVKTLKNE